MSKPTWFDNYCERIDLMWERAFDFRDVIGSKDYDITYLKLKSDSYMNDKNSTMSLLSKAKILRTRYDVASSVLLEQVKKFEGQNKLLFSEAQARFAVNSLFEYYCNSGICERAELKERLWHDISLNPDNYLRKSIHEALDSGLASYMKGLYDRWVKGKDEEFVNGSFNNVLKVKQRKLINEIKETGKMGINTVFLQPQMQPFYYPAQQISFSQKWEELKTIPESFAYCVFTIAFDKASSNENEINKLLSGVARFDCREPIISTPVYRRRKHEIVASTTKYLENLGVVGRNDIETYVGQGLTAAFKGKVDRWLEAETIRNINELYR